MTAERISASTALTFPPRLLTWCCITTEGAGWPSTGANTGFMSTASGCPRSSSTMVGPSPSAIRTTDPDWSSSSAPRCPCHRGMRRSRLACDPRRRPPVPIVNLAGKPGRPPLNHHPGQISPDDRRFRRRRRRARRSRDRLASARRHNLISRYRPPNNLPPNDFRHPSQSQKQQSHPRQCHHRRLSRSPTRRNRTRSYPPANFRRSGRHRTRRIQSRRLASRSRRRSRGRRQRTRRLKLPRNRHPPGQRLPSASGHR
jgi:hypothetical protein